MRKLKLPIGGYKVIDIYVLLFEIIDDGVSESSAMHWLIIVQVSMYEFCDLYKSHHGSWLGYTKPARYSN
jgi:hypothetical protein